jgi:hypothetical protein
MPRHLFSQNRDELQMENGEREDRRSDDIIQRLSLDRPAGPGHDEIH